MDNQKIWKLIESLELASIREKLRKRKGWWWNIFRNLNKIEAEYRQFLYLIALNHDKPVVPWSQDLDDFWHEHILNTSKYTSDCMLVFGKYIHHDTNLPQGTDKHQKAFEETKKMYRSAFRGRNVVTAGYLPGCSKTYFYPVFCGVDPIEMMIATEVILGTINSNQERNCESAEKSCVEPALSSNYSDSPDLNYLNNCGDTPASSSCNSGSSSSYDSKDYGSSPVSSCSSSSASSCSSRSASSCSSSSASSASSCSSS